ncbi:hypothetical protein, partial [Methanoculleus chikugoensis]|uniref:hypothetical protein n=1 Tax=Methanoculleus chikugoensis TaxID=118126 RepID=UPI001FB3AFA3
MQWTVGESPLGGVGGLTGGSASGASLSTDRCEGGGTPPPLSPPYRDQPTTHPARLRPPHSHLTVLELLPFRQSFPAPRGG